MMRHHDSRSARSKGEMSIGVVIALALGLILLLLLMGVLVSKFNLFGKGTGEIETGTQSRLCSVQGKGCYADVAACANGALPVPPQGWIDCASTCCKP